MRALWASVLSGVLLSATGVTALESSIRPKPRPGSEPGFARLLPVFGPAASTPRPRARPALQVSRPAATGLVARSVFPRPRPAFVRPAPAPQPAAVVQTQPSAVTSSGKVGKICGDKDIRGAKVAPIPGKLAGCGVSNPVQVTSVSGVALSTPSTMNCDTAKALKRWVNDGVKPSVKRLGGGLAKLNVAGHYSCRTRNHKPGAKISEHGKGNAIDISAITLKNGQSISVLKHWNKGAEGKVLAKVHKAACGPFGTVLGPDADKYHRDHFHFDTAKHRSGPYCR